MAHHSKKQPREGGKFSKAAGDDGRLPLDIKPEKVAPTAELGVGGTAVYGGYIEEPEKNADLRGRAKYTTYSNAIANVAVIAAGVRLLLNLAGGAQWRVEPAPDSGDAGQEMAKRIEKILHGMKKPWHAIVRRLAAHKFYGFALGEWVARREDDGTIGLLNIQSLPQVTIERWMLDRDGSVIAAIQTSPQTGRDTAIPRQKLIHVVDDALNDSPEGLGLMRHVHDSVVRLRRLQELELWGYSNDLRGVPVGRAPLAELDRAVTSGQITQAQANQLIEGMESFVQRHVRSPDIGLLLDSATYKSTGEQRTPSQVPQWDMQLLDGGTYELDAVATAIVRVQREIARVLGVEHLLLGENSSASRSLSNDKTQSFGLLVDSTLLSIREAVDSDILEPLFELNGWDPALKPTLKTEAQAFRNADEMSAVLRDLATAGVQVDRQDDAVGEIMDLMGLSRLKPLTEIDTDLLLSAEDAQQQAMDIMAAKPVAGGKPGDGPPAKGGGKPAPKDDMPEGDQPRKQK